MPCKLGLRQPASFNEPANSVRKREDRRSSLKQAISTVEFAWCPWSFCHGIRNKAKPQRSVALSARYQGVEEKRRVRPVGPVQRMKSLSAIRSSIYGHLRRLADRGGSQPLSAPFTYGCLNRTMHSSYYQLHGLLTTTVSPSSPPN